jgi:phage terminase small subunit
MRECIRRFDEVLSVKANKMDINELEMVIEKKFLMKKQWADLEATVQKKVQEVTQGMAKIERVVAQYDEGLEQEITKIVKSVVALRLQDYEKVH